MPDERKTKQQKAAAMVDGAAPARGYTFYSFQTIDFPKPSLTISIT